MRLLESPTHAPGVTARLHQVALLPTRAVTSLSLNTKDFPKCLLWPARQPLLKQPPHTLLWGSLAPLHLSSPLLSGVLFSSQPKAWVVYGTLIPSHRPTPEYWACTVYSPKCLRLCPSPRNPST